MPIHYTAKAGDCIASIAFEHGFAPETLWNHPDNAELKTKRKDLYVLAPGDVVVIPDKQPKTVRGETGKRHRFRRKGVPEKLRLRLHDNEAPRKDLSYVLEVDGTRFEGRTNEEGFLEHWIPPNARHGKLTLSEEEVYAIRLGHLAPATEDDGLRERLIHLGYLMPEESGDLALRIALQTFQSDHELPPTGNADEATQVKLREVHGT